MEYKSWLEYIGVPATPAQSPRMRERPRASGRNPYAGATSDRLVADSLATMGILSANAEIRMGLRALRQRARALARNSEFVKSFVRLLRNNVPGPYGFKFASKVRKPRGAMDDVANGLIEGAYKTYSRRGAFTACGTLSRTEFERALCRDLAVDGEFLVELVPGFASNGWGFAVRRLDPDLLDDELNCAWGSTTPGGQYVDRDREIRMGVERDRWGRHTAYWLLNNHRGEDYAANTGAPLHRRMPADRILHRFLADDERPGAVRGVPPLAVALRRMGMLAGYEDAALVGARAGASKMAFYQPPEDGPNNPDELADAEEDGNLLSEFEPGTMGVLPPGWDIKSFDPTYPNEKFGDFRKAMLRAFAAGVGINYNAIASDLEGVNLSSIRYGVQDDRAVYEALQNWFIENLCEPIYGSWLPSALAFGKIGRLPMGPDAEARFNAPLFTGRGWQYMDPLKDVKTDKESIDLRIKSRTRVCAERGEDFEEVLAEIKNDEALAQAYGVTLLAAQPAAPSEPAAKPTAAASAEADESGKPENEDE